MADQIGTGARQRSASTASLAASLTALCRIRTLAVLAAITVSSQSSAALIDAFTTPAAVVGTQRETTGLHSIQGGVFDQRRVDIETYGLFPRQMSHQIIDGAATFGVGAGNAANPSDWAYGMISWYTTNPNGVDLSELTSLSFDYRIAGGGFYFDLTIVTAGGTMGGVLPRPIAGIGSVSLSPQELQLTSMQLRSVQRIMLAFRQYADPVNSIEIMNLNANGVETVPAPGALALCALGLAARRRRR